MPTILGDCNSLGTKQNPSAFDALSKAEPDEPYFTLLARDPIAATLVRRWATEMHSKGLGQTKTFEALNVANEMDAWRKEYDARPKPPVIADGDE